MENEFVKYEQALTLKEIGFKEDCFGYYSNGELVYNNHTNNAMQRFRYSAPLKQQALRWFRDIHKLRGFIGWRPNRKKYDCHIVDMTLDGMAYVKERTFKKFNEDPIFDTYEEAESAVIDLLIEKIKNNENKII